MSLDNALCCICICRYLIATSSSPPLQCNFTVYTLYCPAWGTLKLVLLRNSLQVAAVQNRQFTHNVGNTQKMSLLIGRPRCQIRLAGNPRYLYLFFARTSGRDGACYFPTLQKDLLLYIRSWSRVSNIQGLNMQYQAAHYPLLTFHRL